MQQLRPGIDRAMAAIAAPIGERFLASRRLTVLAYHGVEDAVPFDRQIAWLSKNRTLVSGEQAQAILLGDSPAPERGTLITFDDGETSVHDTALPVLIGHAAAAVVFVVSSLIDSDTPFWWSQVEMSTARGARSNRHPDLEGRALVRELKAIPDAERRAIIGELLEEAPADARPQLTTSQLRHLLLSGVAVGNHTKTHPCLHNCPPETLEREIVGAADDLAEVLGARPALFAYPNGDHDARCDPFLRQAGHEVAFLFDHRLAEAPSPDPLRVSRVRVNASDSLERFRSIVSGAHPLLHRSLGRT